MVENKLEQTQLGELINRQSIYEAVDFMVKATSEGEAWGKALINALKDVL